MPIFICIYHQRTTWQKVICQKVTGSLKTQDGIRQIENGLAAIMYCREGSTRAESLEAAERLATEWCDKYAGQVKLVSHFKKYWLPKIGTTPLAARPSDDSKQIVLSHTRRRSLRSAHELQYAAIGRDAASCRKHMRPTLGQISRGRLAYA